MQIEIISRAQDPDMDCLHKVIYTFENKYFKKHEKVIYTNKLSTTEELLAGIESHNNWRETLPNCSVTEVLFGLDRKYQR